MRVANPVCVVPEFNEQIGIGPCFRDNKELCLADACGGFDLTPKTLEVDQSHHFGEMLIEQTVGNKSECLSTEQTEINQTYDGPPILSPNYATNDRNEFTELHPDECPPALTQEFEINAPRRGRGRPRRLKRSRSSIYKVGKHRSPKTESDLSLIGAKTSKQGQSRAAAGTHRSNNAPVVIPHSSAEIQERVKNRQRKTTQSYGSALDSALSISEIVDKPAQKLKRRKISSGSSSNSEGKISKTSKSQNGLFIVEKILKKGIINGLPYFFVKWLNYPCSQNTWEPEENFSLDLITAYEKKVTETGQLVKVVDGVDINQPPPEFKSVMRSTSSKPKQKCPGCLSYPHTFTDQRRGLNGFDEGLTYHKILQSFVLDNERCALVEFEEKHCLELIPMKSINERLKAEINLH